MLHVGNGGMCFIDSVELDELYTPIYVRTRRLIPTARARVVSAARLASRSNSTVGCDMDAGFVADGNIHVPQARARACHRRRRTSCCGAPTERRRKLAQSSLIRIAAVRHWCRSHRGRGYGDPKTRDPQRVRHDVRERLISRSVPLQSTGRDHRERRDRLRRDGRLRA